LKWLRALACNGLILTPTRSRRPRQPLQPSLSLLRAPRERPPVVALDDGPLILVETRRDLREMTLPFEGATNASP
jgi:hypothetical protein